MEEIQKLLLSKKKPEKAELNKMKIFKGDLLLLQKKYDLAEKEYLSCEFDNNDQNDQNHRNVRLAVLYQLILQELQHGKTKIDKLEEFTKNLKNILENFSEKFADDENRSLKISSMILGFKFMMEKLLGMDSSIKEINFKEYQAQILKQITNQENLQKCKDFFYCLGKDLAKAKTIFADIGTMLVVDLETQSVAHAVADQKDLRS